MTVRCSKCTDGYSDMYVRVIYQDNYPPEDIPAQEERVLCFKCFVNEIKDNMFK